MRRFSFDCVLGMLAREQDRPQRLVMDLALRLDLEPAAAGDLKRSVHYGDVLNQVQFIAQRGHWLLLESLAHAIARQLLMPPLPNEPRRQIDEAVVCLSKPDVFRGRATPAVEIRRCRGERGPAPKARPSPGVRAAVLNETRESGAYQFLLDELTTWVVPPRASAMVIAGQASVRGEPRARRKIIDAGEPCTAASTGVGLLVAAKRPLSGDWL